MTREEAVLLARLLRSVCLLSQKHTLHVGGHIISPAEAAHAPRQEPKS